MAGLVRSGRCHVFGDHLPIDEGIMPFRLAIARVNDPQALIPHLFEGVDPGFRERVKPGDFVIAGRDFACGKTHIQGFVAMAALKMNVVCASMPYKAMRRAVAGGLPVLVGCENAAAFASTGDEIEVDFSTGEAKNLTRGTAMRFPAMSPILRDLAANGGTRGALVTWLRDHPEQAAAKESVKS
jgi:3-isopropylmalate/(R)-2-methylmalate dehydratase small subunit